MSSEITVRSYATHKAPWLTSNILINFIILHSNSTLCIFPVCILSLFLYYRFLYSALTVYSEVSVSRRVTNRIRFSELPRAQETRPGPRSESEWGARTSLLRRRYAREHERNKRTWRGESERNEWTRVMDVSQGTRRSEDFHAVLVAKHGLGLLSSMKDKFPCG